MAESIVQVNSGSGPKLHTFQRTIGANNVEDEVVLVGEPYLASYTVNANGVSSATALSHLVQVMAGASLKVYIRRIQIYQQALATAAAIGRLFLYRLTTAGTGGGALVTSPLDSTDAASGATAMSLPTVKGTEAAAAILVASAAFIQTAPAGGGNTLLADWRFDQKSKSLIIPAGVANGIAVKCVDAIAAGTVLVNVEFAEANF